MHLCGPPRHLHPHPRCVPQWHLSLPHPCGLRGNASLWSSTPSPSTSSMCSSMASVSSSSLWIAWECIFVVLHAISIHILDVFLNGICLFLILVDCVGMHLCGPPRHLHPHPRCVPQWHLSLPH